MYSSEKSSLAVGLSPYKIAKKTPLQGRLFYHFAWLVAFTNSSQIISTHILTVLAKRCNVILQIEQEQKGGCLYEYK